MRKYVWLIGILVIAMLVVSGCGKKQQSVVSTGGSNATAPAASTATAPAAGGISTIDDLRAKIGGLNSYSCTMDSGATKTRMTIKLDSGKPVAAKMDMGPSLVIVRFDKKMEYMVNQQAKTAMAIPIPESAMSAAQKDPIAQLKAMAGAKVSSEAVDGIDCLKVQTSATTVWCDKKNGLPVQTEAMGTKTKFKYEQVNSVPDSEFELPAGVKIQQMPTMPGGGPGMPNMPKMPK